MITSGFPLERRAMIFESHVMHSLYRKTFLAAVLNTDINTWFVFQAVPTLDNFILIGPQWLLALRLLGPLCLRKSPNLHYVLSMLCGCQHLGL